MFTPQIGRQTPHLLVLAVSCTAAQHVRWKISHLLSILLSKICKMKLSIREKISGKWRYQKASATSVSTVCGSGWSTWGSPPWILARLGYRRSAAFPMDEFAGCRRIPCLFVVRKGEGARYRASFSGSYRLLSYSGIQQIHGSQCRRSCNRHPAMKRIRRDRFRKIKEKPRCPPSLSLLREFRTCIRGNASAQCSRLSFTKPRLAAHCE